MKFTYINNNIVSGTGFPTIRTFRHIKPKVTESLLRGRLFFLPIGLLPFAELKHRWERFHRSDKS